MLDLRLGDVERVLLRVPSLADKELSVLRGRILHLRRTDVVPLPKTGGGRQIVYSMDDVRWLCLALILNFEGIQPTTIKNLLQTWNGFRHWFARSAADPELTDWVMFMFGPARPGGPDDELSPTIFCSEKRGERYVHERVFDFTSMRESTRPHILLNFSAIERALRRAVDEVIAEREAGGRGEEPLAATG